MVFPYNYDMNIRIYRKKTTAEADAIVLPTPSEWNYQVGDLDTSGSRDATGTLHRAYVATKINYEFQWKALEWEMLQLILDAVNKPAFWMAAPDPRTYASSYKGKYYVGDRTGKNYYFLKPPVNGVNTGAHSEIAVFDLKLKFIEY